MSTVTAPPGRLSELQRSEVARAWSRRGPAAGSLAFLDSELDSRSATLSPLRDLGIRVRVFHDDLVALVHLGADRPEVVVVSSALPTSSLARLVAVVREEVGAPVLLALEAGATDEIGPAVAAGARPVVHRPYQLEDLLTAVEPHWPRRARQPAPLSIGDLELDIDGYDARLAGVGVDFTSIEFELIAVLAQSADHVVLRTAIGQRFWPLSTDPDGALVATITRVRRKLAQAGAPNAVHTVRGLGYRLESAGLLVGPSRTSVTVRAQGPSRARVATGPSPYGR